MNPVVPSSRILAALRRSLLAWYGREQRDLPWRRTRDPYRVWVSEIMLQQTRVAAVLEHYRRWMELFPNVRTLASAELDEVLAAWSGLGYYRRARMLHQAAQVVVSSLGGELPLTSAELRKLPGVGRYTAAAIASIAHGEPAAVVDGNVERVLSRFCGRAVEGEELWQAAQAWLVTPSGASSRRVRGATGAAPAADARATDAAPVTDAGAWNQAMMELGATVCTPLAARCEACPLEKWCASAGTLEQADAAKSKKPEVRRRKRVARLLAMRGEKLYLVQREATAAKMAGMWELPETEPPEGEKPLLRARHSITDTDYEVDVYASDGRGLRGGCWFTTQQAARLALTGLTRKVLRRRGLLAEGTRAAE